MYKYQRMFTDTTYMCHPACGAGTFAPADSVFEAETVASVAYFLNSGYWARFFYVGIHSPTPR